MRAGEALAHRLFVLVASVAVLVIGAGALASASAAPQASRVMVCPLARSVIITCCGPPVAHAGSSGPVLPPLCCPANALCGMGLTVRSAPNPLSAAGQVMISGQMLGSAAVDSPVVLWQRLAGRRRFHRLLQTSTSAGGQFAIIRAPGTVATNRLWYVTARGLRSPTLSQRVRAIITLTASAPSADASHVMKLRGHVTPSHPRERVVLEQLRQRSWQVIARSRLNRASNFVATHPFPPGAAAHLRAVLSGDPRNTRSVSAVITASP